MELELWWLLAFLAFFGLGWVAARIDIRHLLKESRSVPTSYFRGLNFLLNEQPDKAIEAFNEVVKVDPQTLDLHFALGSLFRRQGEVERAIRIHQGLLERPDLPADKRPAATYELAQDFQKAGLLDRAEEAFGKLAGTPLEQQATRHLLQIHEQGKEWDKAIATAQRLEALTHQPLLKEIAHYHCEIAGSELMQSRFDAARARIGQALASHRGCARATLLAGDVAAAQGEDEAAIAQWQRVETQDPAFLALAAERFAQAYRRLGRAGQGLRLLEGYQAQYPSVDLFNALYQLTLEERGPEAARELARAELSRHPTLLGLDKLLEVELLRASTERRRDLELVKGLVAQHTRRLGTYRCDHCGFRAKQYYWRCPGCARWETYPPHRSEGPEGHAA